jgi:hypothetical protein
MVVSGSTSINFINGIMIHHYRYKVIRLQHFLDSIHVNLFTKLLEGHVQCKIQDLSHLGEGTHKIILEKVHIRSWEITLIFVPL